MRAIPKIVKFGLVCLGIFYIGYNVGYHNCGTSEIISEDTDTSDAVLNPPVSSSQDLQLQQHTHPGATNPPAAAERRKTTVGGKETLVGGHKTTQNNGTQATVEKPLNIFLYSSLPRSGSSMFGELLSTKPESIYIYETLHLYNKDELFMNSIGHVQDLYGKVFNCSFDEKFELHLKHFYFNYFNDDSRNCLALKEDGKRKACIKALDLKSICRHSNSRIQKVIRGKLSYLEDFLQNPDINLKVIYLTRDPRASLNSIVRFKWNSDPFIRCTDILRDMNTFDELYSKFPNKITHVPMENFSLNPNNVTSKLFKFLYGDSTLPPETITYLEAHTKSNTGKGRTSTSRDSKKESEKWRTEISQKVFEKTENESLCRQVIVKMGHNLFGEHKNVKNLDIHLKVWNPIK